MGSIVTPTNTPPATYYWSILGHDWSTLMAIDEFGQGTLDGNVAHGGAFDACGPAAIHNLEAAFLQSMLDYTRIGHHRYYMITQGFWTPGATVQNPRTSGCYIENIAWYIPQISGGSFTQSHLTTAGNVFSADQVHSYMDLCRNGRSAPIYIMTNAQALTGNEQNVHGHFVATAAYDSATDKQYILNSDIGGQHGIAQGQWIDMPTFLAAQPVGAVLMSLKPPAPPPPPVAVTVPFIINGATYQIHNGNLTYS